MQIMEASVLGNGTFRTLVTGLFGPKTIFFSMALICACEVNGSILGPGLIRHSKKISNDQELIQSDPISCPQNQKGNN